MELINKNDYSFKSLIELEKMKSYDKMIMTRFYETLKTNWNDCLYRDILNHISSYKNVCFLLTARNKFITPNYDLKMEMLGFIIVYDKNFYRPFRSYSDVRFIHLVDTFFPKLNICMFMIEKLEKRLKTKLLPYTIAKGAKEYWKKYFLRKYNIQSKTEMDLFKKNNLLPNDLYNDLFIIY